MIRVRFASTGGIVEAEGRPGDRLLDVARAAGQKLEGTCNGELACATCHVVVDAGDVLRIVPAREEEEDLLDLVPGAVRTSRLACQIVLAPALDGLTVHIPS